MSAAPLLILVRARSPGPHLVREPTDRITVCGEVPIAPWKEKLTEEMMKRACPKCGVAARELSVRMKEYAQLAKRHESWRAGDLRFLLDETQQRIYDAAHAAWRLGEAADTTTLAVKDLTLEALAKRPKRQFAARCSRRLGKSTVAGVLAAEIAIKRPGSTIIYVAKDAVDIAKVVYDIFEHPDTGLLKSCPPDVKPAWKEQAKIYEFKNGSVLELHGADDGKIEDLRGRAAHFIVPDEIGAWQDPEYALKSVLIPMTHTTDGRIFIPTTPAKTPGHPSKAILDDLEAKGLASRFTIIDSRRLTPIQKVEALVDAGETPEHALVVVQSNGAVLPIGTTARRELFVMDVTDAGSAFLPEFQDVESKLLVRVVNEKPNAETPGNRYVERPQYFFGFTSVDPAPTNIIAIVCGYHDFHRDVFVFQRSAFPRGKDTTAAALADMIHALERECFGDTLNAGGHQQPSVRIIDPDSQLEKELRPHGLLFRHANKKDVNSMGSRQALRAMLTSGRIEIDESNGELRRQMRESVLNKSAKDIAFEADGTHGDGIKTVQYAVRTVPVRSPFPAGWRESRYGPDVVRAKVQPSKTASLVPQTEFGGRLAAVKPWWNRK